jgi:hypothetical protein
VFGAIILTSVPEEYWVAVVSLHMYKNRTAPGFVVVVGVVFAGFGVVGR